MDEERDFTMDYFDEFGPSVSVTAETAKPAHSTSNDGGLIHDDDPSAAGVAPVTNSVDLSKDDFIDSLFTSEIQAAPDATKGNSHMEISSVNSNGPLTNGLQNGETHTVSTVSSFSMNDVAFASDETALDPPLDTVEEVAGEPVEVPIEIPLDNVVDNNIISEDEDDAAASGIKVEEGYVDPVKSKLQNANEPSFYEQSPTTEGMREMATLAMDDESNHSDETVSIADKSDSYESMKDTGAKDKKQGKKSKTVNDEEFLHGMGLADKVKERENSKEGSAVSDEIGESSAPHSGGESGTDKMTCTIPNCRNYNNTKADHVFAFPDAVAQFATRKQWLKKINEANSKSPLSGITLLNQPLLGVCSQHFVKDDFVHGYMAYPGKGVKYEIKSTAVPSIFKNKHEYIEKPKPPKTTTNAASASSRQYATKTVEAPKKKGPSSVDSTTASSETASSAKGKRNHSDNESENGGEKAVRKSKVDNDDDDDYHADEPTHWSSDEEFVPNKKPPPKKILPKVAYPQSKVMQPLKKVISGGVSNTDGSRILPGTVHVVRMPADLTKMPKTTQLTTVNQPRPVLSTVQANQGFTVETVRPTIRGGVPGLTYQVLGPGSSAPISVFQPRVTSVSVPHRAPLQQNIRARQPAPLVNIAKPNPVSAPNQPFNARAPRPTLVIPAPPISAAKQSISSPEISLPPVVQPTTTSGSAWKNSRAPSRAVAVQAGAGELDAGWDDEEIKDVMREAHEEILELKYGLEIAEMDLSVERNKVTHLEARVAAWIREHFNQMGVEADRLDIMDKLANYYLETARKVEDGRMGVAKAFEDHKNTFGRNTKETDAYRQQIIELQNNSARQVETLQAQKNKQERESQEIIAALRRQLSEAITAKSTAEWELRVEKYGAKEAGPPPNTGTKSRGPRKPRVSATIKAATPVVSVPPTPKPVSPVKPTVQYVNPHLANAPSTSGSQHQQHNLTVQYSASMPVQSSAPSPPKRARGRPPTSGPATQPQQGYGDDLPDPSPKKNGTRESSVERAVRYLMSL